MKRENTTKSNEMDSHSHQNTVSCCNSAAVKGRRKAEMLLWQEEQMSKCLNDNAVNKLMGMYMNSSTVDDREKFIAMYTEHNLNFAKNVMEEEIAVYSAVDTLGLHTCRARHTDHANRTINQLTDYSHSHHPDCAPGHISARVKPTLSNTTSNLLASNASSGGICENSDENEHDEFLEAAVSAAIQEKGLCL